MSLEGGAMAVMQRDLRLALSYRFSLFAPSLGALLSLVLFYYVSRLVRVESLGSHDDYYAYVVVGLVILQILQSTFMTLPTGLRTELVTGTFERLLLSPLGPVTGIVAMSAVPFALGLVSGASMLALAGVAFGVDIEWSSAWLALPLAMLGWAALAPFGFLTAALVVLVKQATSTLAWLMAVVALVSGLYFPVAVLPNWIEWASDVQPFTPLVDLMRHVLVDTQLGTSAWVEVAKVAAFAILLMPASVLALRTAIRTARRRGTIIEY